MKARYIGDLRKGKDIVLTSIESFGGETFEQKLALAEHLTSTNKNLRLFDENKQMIGDIEMDEKSALFFIEQKLKDLAEREEKLDEREEKLDERESLLNKREAELNKVETVTTKKSGKSK